MQGKNRCFRRSHRSEAKFRAIIRYFAHDLPAWKIAELSGVSRPTINQLFMKLRIKIAQVCNASSPLSGEVEVDESCFDARCVRGKRGRGAGGKPIVFGITERHGKVSEVVPDAPKKYLQSAIRGQVVPDSIIHSDGWRGYNGLVDMGYKKHFWVHHGEHEFARGNCHINGMSHSGHMPNGGLQSSMLFLDKRSFFIAERKISLIEHLPLLKENPL